MPEDLTVTGPEGEPAAPARKPAAKRYVKPPAPAGSKFFGPKFWGALAVLCVVAFVVAEYVTDDSASKFTMYSQKVPLGRFYIKPIEFSQGLAGENKKTPTSLSVWIGNDSQEPLDIRKVTVHFLDVQGLRYDPPEIRELLAPLVHDEQDPEAGDSNPPLNPGMRRKREWLFSTPGKTVFRFVVFLDEEEKTSVQIDLGE